MLTQRAQWVFLPGRSLADVEADAIRACFERTKGNRRQMARELGLSKSTLLRKLDRLGLRHRTPRLLRRLREQDLERAFKRHRRQIAMELRIQDSTLLRWLNSKAPFAVEE